MLCILYIAEYREPSVKTLHFLQTHFSGFCMISGRTLSECENENKLNLVFHNGNHKWVASHLWLSQFSCIHVIVAIAVCTCMIYKNLFFVTCNRTQNNVFNFFFGLSVCLSLSARKYLNWLHQFTCSFYYCTRI